MANSKETTVFYANKFDKNDIEEKLYLAVYLDDKSGEINTLLGEKLRTEKAIDEIIYKVNNDKYNRRDYTYVKISYDELLAKSQTIKKEINKENDTAIEAVIPATELDYEAVEGAFELIQEMEGVALVRSTANEKYLVIDNSLTELEETRKDEYYLTTNGATDLLQNLALGGQSIFESDEQKAREHFDDTLKRQRETMTPEEKAYKTYLLKLRDEIGAQDWLSYAMTREEFQQGPFEQEFEFEPPQASAGNVPFYDIHDTYHNDKQYEKNTPLNLRARKQFVCWKYEWDDKRTTWKKIPYNPNTGNKASSVAFSTWSDFDTACKAVDKYHFDGVGIMFAKGLMGIDIDHCIDADGNISDRAREVINTVNSYTELSPSGTGVHILAFGELPGTRTRADEFEMYHKGRFFTLTGKPFEGVFRKIPKASDTQAAIDLMYDKYINVKRDLLREPVPVSDKPLTYSDEEILSKCRSSANVQRFERLWSGDWSQYVGHGEQSSADAALIGMLAYYSDDEYQIDRLFRQSGLMRPKWDEQHGDMTYGRKSITYVLNEPGRPRYNPKYYYETHIKPKLEKKDNSSEWTTIKLLSENFVQDYQRCKNFQITKGELAGAKFFYPSSLITKTEDGYNLKVKNDFTFKVRPKNSNTDIELGCSDLRRALAGQPISKPLAATSQAQPSQNKPQTEFD